MQFRRKAVLIGTFILVCSLFLGLTQVRGKATTTPFYALERVKYVGPPEKKWVEDGILYIRNQLFLFDVFQGDFKGTVVYIGNWNVDLTTRNGTGWGTNEFIGEWVTEGPFKGSIAWKGNSVMRVTGWKTYKHTVTGKFVSHGEEGLEGMLIKGIMEPDITGAIILSGTILNPHG